MSDIFSSVGTIISVSSALPATENAAGYAALTFSPVSEASEVPEHGSEQALAQHTPLATGIVQKRGGSIDAGEFTLPFALSDDDAGQAILRAKSEGGITDEKRASFKEELPTGEIIYYIGLCRSFKRNIGGADAIAMGSVVVSVTSLSVVVDAP